MSKGMLGALSLSDVQGPMNDLEQKLAGLEGSRWLFALKHFLRKEPSWPVLRVWKTIRVGQAGPRDARYPRSILEKENIYISGDAELIAEKSAERGGLLIESISVDLVILSGADLGFTERVSTANLYISAHELGLELCPAEVGPALRLAYRDQPGGECLLVAMKPRIIRGLREAVYTVSRGQDGDLWLGGASGSHLCAWPLDTKWVFVLQSR